jgi:ribosomal protein S27AE
MINIDIAVFIGFFLDILIVIYFILYCLSNKSFIKKEKRIDLMKKKCEICGTFSFINSRDGYWKCPDCESLNRGR